MKLLKWADENGFKRQSWVKNNDVVPEYGIPYDPPDLSSLELSQEKCRELHNRLIESGLITYLDVLKSGSGVTSILRQMDFLKYRQQILLLYKLDRR